MINNTIHLNEINAPKQKIMASVEVIKNSTLIANCTCEDALIDFKVERVGEGKFFGYGICQKLTVNLIDKERQLAIDADCMLRVKFTVNDNNCYPFTYFYINPNDITRDEETNNIEIVAYDAISKAANYTFSDLGLEPPYTYNNVLQAAKTLLNITSIQINNLDNWEYTFENGANFDGTENLRAVLDALAEATQTVYFLTNRILNFARNTRNNIAIAYSIDRNKYFTLKTQEPVVLAGVCHTTALEGNGTEATAEGVEGVTQYVRDNPFWEAIAADGNIGDTLNTVIDKVGGSSIAQFNCEWAGNYLLQPVDRIALETEDGNIITSFVLDDTIFYDGTLSQITAFKYTPDERETAANPSNLGDALNKTFARVDKVNKQVEIVVSDVEANKSEIAAIRADTESITATVSSLETSTEAALDDIQTSIQSLETQITQTAENVKIEIKQEIQEQGADKVTTATGFTFDESGLTIHEEGKEVTTNINNNGMTVYKNEEAVLVANEEGVTAVDLHAKTYLLIGESSRLEDWENADNSRRTACFWIGGI